MELIYTWIPIYNEIVTKIKPYRSNQNDLLDILKQAGVDSFNDKDDTGNTVPLDEIDPFTFLCYLNKYGDIRRKKILRKVCQILGIESYAKDVCGIPTTNAQKLWLFPYKVERVNDEINRLWNFFESFIANKITDTDFADILKIVSVGKQKTTEVMYMVKPYDYLCLNGVVKPYLQEKYQISTDYNSFTELQQLYATIKRVVQLPFPEISYKAYLHKQYNRQPIKYFRIGSRDGTNGETMLPDMLENNIVSIGWYNLGNIEDIEPLTKAGIKEALQRTGHYEGDNRTASKKAGEILRFYNDIVPGDIVALADGQSIRAIGKITTDHYVYEEDLNFPHCRSVEWLRRDIDDLIIDEGLLTSVWQYEYPDSIEKINSYLGLNNTDSINNSMNTIINKARMPLNTILFGPPGTGKTYKLQQIIKEWNLIEKTESSPLNYVEFAEEYTWWQLAAMALLDLKQTSVSQLKQHPLIQAKFNNSSIKSFSARLWSTLQIHTVWHCENVKVQYRQADSLVFFKDENSIWRLDNEIEFKTNYPELVEAWNKFNQSNNNSKEIKKYIFTTCHQSLSYEDFIEGIKPMLANDDAAENELGNSSLQYEIRKGIFYKACNRACQLAGYSNLDECLHDTIPNRKEKFEIALKQNNIMVLFLDEINRCNVSAVFGELITLIESDKRLGAKNEISDIILPYSQKPFGVPANLYIIGTMNTADRSVEALDTALRRRFSFESMPPTIEPIKDNEVGDISLSYLLTKINERIAALLNSDHLIGHSYFIDISTEEQLKAVFENRIIPLLQEYFYNDYAKIGLVLGSSFVETKQESVLFPKNFEYENKQEFSERISYTLISADKWTTSSFLAIYQE